MSRKRTYVLLVGVMLGILLAALDQTIVGTAMPRIVSQLGGLSLYSWVFTAYMLASTTSIPLFGKLSDMYGRRPFYLLGVATFLLGSGLSGAAGTMMQLIAFRGLQGVGGGIMMASSMAVIGDIFSPAERGKWQGVIGAAFGLASIVGPTIGGYVTDNLSWRWVFYVNLPVGLLAFAVLYAALPRFSASGKRRVDYLGALTLVMAVVPALLAFSWAGAMYPWDSARVLVPFGVSALMIAGFVVTELRAAEPIIPMSLFSNPVFTVSAIVVFLTGVGMFGTIMFIPLFVQGVIGTSATSSGLVLTPMMLSMIVGSTISGQILSRSGRYRVLALAGIAVMGSGVYLLSRMGVQTTNADAVRNMLVVGFGLGVTMPLFVITVQNALPYGQLGVVTSSVQFFRSVGGTVGVAVMGTVMSGRLHRELRAAFPPGAAGSVSPGLAKVLGDAQALLDPEALAKGLNLPGHPGPDVVRSILAALRSALAASIAEVFLVALVFVGAAFVASMLLKEVPLRRTAPVDR